MKVLTILLLIFLGLWLPVAFMDAMELQASIDAMQASMARMSRSGQ